MVGFRKAIAAAAAPLALVLTLGAGTASASSAAAKPVTTTHAATKSVSPNSLCAITEYGYTGQRICGYDYTSFDWGGGNVEYFVIGGDYAIWHIWNGSGGWQSLGGTAGAFSSNGVYPISNVTGVWTYGTDGNRWCNDWGTPWSGWHLC